MRRALLVGLSVLTLAFGVQAQDKAASSNFMKPVYTNGLITLQPLNEFDSFELVVRGPEGIVLRQTINGMQTPFIETYDQNGEYLADGQYAFELRANPIVSAEIKQIMRDARQSGDYSDLNQLREAGYLPNRAEAVTGYFTIVDGLIVVPEGQEESFVSRVSTKTDGRASGDVPGTPTGGDTSGGTVDSGESDSDVASRQVIAQDLMVQGSECVGVDCGTSESFGFDTLRLKENNLRIKFDDTSGSGSFPNNDWQITANDSNNGGANKFSIDDITGSKTPFTLEAGAPNNSLYVDDAGKVGIGTSTPAVNIHVKEGDSPTLRLEQDASSGFTAQTWDIAANETNFFVRDVTNGSKLPFRIKPNSPKNSLFIDSTGVGLGTETPDSKAHIIGKVLVSDADNGAVTDQKYVHVVGEDAAIHVERDSTTGNNSFDIANLINNGRVFIRMEDTAQSKTWFFGTQSSDILINDAGDAEEDFRLAANGNLTIAGSLTEMSDRASKENIRSVNSRDVLAKVIDLPLSTWNYIDTEDEVRHLGPMAQDFFAAFGLNNSPKGISTLDTSGVALAAIQGLNEVIQEKDAQIQDLEARLKALEDKLMGTK